MIQSIPQSEPCVTFDDGSAINASEFLYNISQFSPSALSDYRFQCLVKMAFKEDRSDALMAARDRASEIAQSVNPTQGFAYWRPPSYPPQPQPSPQPVIVFSPQISVNPSFQNSPTTTATTTTTTTQTQPVTTPQSTQTAMSGTQVTIAMLLAAIVLALVVGE